MTVIEILFVIHVCGWRIELNRVGVSLQSEFNEMKINLFGKKKNSKESSFEQGRTQQGCLIVKRFQNIFFLPKTIQAIDLNLVMQPKG